MHGCSSEFLQSIATRIWARVKKGRDDECWLWPGTSTSGYGLIRAVTPEGPRNLVVTRVIIAARGVYLNDADKVKHTCGVRLCCNPKHLYIKVRPVAPDSLVAYNPPQRNEISLANEVDPLLLRLRPLKTGATVALHMDNELALKNPKYVGPKHKLVLIAPGSVYGLKEGLFLISVVGSGSVVIDHRTQSVAKLVLAGMPLRLAQALVTTIHRVMKEK